MLMWPKPEMLHRLPAILRAPQQQRPRPSRLPHRQLIQRQHLPTSLLDASPRRAREPQCRDAQFRDLDETVVICDGADDYDGLVGVGGCVVGVCGRGDDAREGHGGAVGFGHEEAAEDGGIEAGVGAAWSSGQCEGLVGDGAMVLITYVRGICRA